MSRRSRPRKRRIDGFDYSSINGYFITTNIRRDNFDLGQIIKGEMLLNENGEIVKHCWYDLVNHYSTIELDAFVVMPDHVHGIVFIRDYVHGLKQPLLFTVIGSFKSYSAKRINQRVGSLGSPVWQTSFYDRVIRSEAELNAIRQYIANNPHRWSLHRRSF
jgi:REP element-mobilizing transposase RayT